MVLAMVLVAAIRIAEVFLPWHDWLPAAIYQPVVGLIGSSGIRLGESVTGLASAVMDANNLISVALIAAFTAAMYSITGGLRAVIKTGEAFGGHLVGAVGVEHQQGPTLEPPTRAGGH